MRDRPRCPRCGGEVYDVQAPNRRSSAWTCALHGEVAPLQPVVAPRAEVLRAVVRRSGVPVWLPWPLPRGWVVTGVAHAGDERATQAVAMACSGSAPLGGLGELVIVAEEAGVGLGAHLAGMVGPDPGGFDASGQPHAKVYAAGHPASLWFIDCPEDRAIYVGEALACWLWIILWPAQAGHLLVETVVLTDLREAPSELELPFGALSPRLSV